MGIAREGLEPHRWNRRRRGSLILLKIVHFSRDSWTSSVQSRVGVTFLAKWSWVCSPGIREFVRGVWSPNVGSIGGWGPRSSRKSSNSDRTRGLAVSSRESELPSSLNRLCTPPNPAFIRLIHINRNNCRCINLAHLNLSAWPWHL